MNMIKNLKITLFSILLISFLGCENKNDEMATSGVQPTITVKLVDAPGEFKAVNVEVVDVMIKMDDDSDNENGWMSLDAQNETVNLLDFTGGITKVLVDKFPIPAGTLSQMRLVLGDGNTIVIENDQEVDEEFDLKTPSAQQSGLKLKVNSVIEPGYAYDFILDFDVEKSIVIAGNSGNIILKPVLYVSTEANSGIIEGSVSPQDVPAMAYVIVDDMGNDDPEDDIIISAYTDETGAFALWGVPGGTYDVIVEPVDEASDYANGIAEAVSVTNGETTIISEPIELPFKPSSITGKVLELPEGVLATASIMVDGNPVTDETDETGVFLLEEVPAGDYTLTVSAEGYVSQEINITVTPNAETIVDDITLVAE
ncbi:DUF4382 domain-containing protein [Flavobacteriaceae bacterium SZ-1-7]|uniref:DUF4382 domain-containing protein n=1 Tax=Tamlana sedimenti TaxID=3134126 RepID=UPI003126DCE8